MTQSYPIYSGAGNTFVLVDARTQSYTNKQGAELCSSYKVDGALFLKESSKAHFAMHTVNADGSCADMCGNGLRCLIAYLRDNNITQERYQIETPAGIHKAWFVGEEVCIELPPPKNLKWNLPIPIEGSRYTAHHLNTGVPHAVIFAKDIETLPVETLGPKIRNHPEFSPAGVNVNFVSLKQPFEIRTYERGVEAETQACGTGTIAAALAIAKCHDIFSPITLTVRSGDKIKISFTPDWSRVTMQGPAEKVS